MRKNQKIIISTFIVLFGMVFAIPIVLASPSGFTFTLCQNDSTMCPNQLYKLTIPTISANDTIPLLGVTQTWTGTDTFNALKAGGQINLNGQTVLNTGTITFPTTTGTLPLSGSALTETAEATQTPLAGATSTVPGISLRWYQFYTIPSTEKFYLITGIEWKNLATVAGNVQCGVDRVNANPPTLAPVQLLAFSSQVAQSGASAIQRNSQIVSHPIKAGTIVGAWCESDSSTATFGTTAVTSNNNRKTITFAASPPNQDVTAWTASAVGFSVKIYYVGYN